MCLQAILCHFCDNTYKKANVKAFPCTISG